MVPYGRKVQGGIKRQQPLLIKGNAGLQKASGRAGDNDPDVDELLALDLWHHANNGIVKRTVIGHGPPPPGTYAGAQADGAGTPGTRCGARCYSQTPPPPPAMHP